MPAVFFMNVARAANDVIRQVCHLSYASATVAAVSSGVISSYVSMGLPLAGLTDVIPIIRR